MDEATQKIIYSKNRKENLNDYLKGKSVILVGPAPYLEGQRIGSLIDSHDVVVRLKSGYPIPTPLQKDVGKRIDLWYTNMKPDQNYLNNATIDEMEKNNLKTIVFPYPIAYQRTDAFRLKVLRLINLLQYNFRKGIELIQKHYQRRNRKCPFDISFDDTSYYFQNMEKVIGCRPTTGMLAIMDLLQYDIKKLQLVGFTFRYEVLQEQEKQSTDLNLFEGNSNKLLGLYSKYYKNQKSAVRSWKKTLANRTHDIKKELIFLKRLRQIENRLKVDNYLEQILNQMVDSRQLETTKAEN